FKCTGSRYAGPSEWRTPWPLRGGAFIHTHQASREAAHRMLVLTRKSNQSIMIGDDIEVSVHAIMGEKVRIGIRPPRDIQGVCKEVCLESQEEGSTDSGPPRGARQEVDAALRELGKAG